jgi:cobalt-zinc-cadmium efflux system protein
MTAHLEDGRNERVGRTVLVRKLSSKIALEIALALTVGILVVEIIGGLRFGSSALVADALHVFTDIFAIGFSLIALSISARPPTSRLTYGYHRLEVLASLTNGISLFFISGIIMLSAYSRFLNPIHIDILGTILVAALAFVINIVSNRVIDLSSHPKALLLSPRRRDENVFSASTHIFGDALASLAVIFGALAVYFTGRALFDPLVAVLIGILVLKSAVTITWNGLSIVLERSPVTEMPVLEKELEKIDGVSDVHDLHVWRICSHITVATLHACLTDRGRSNRVETMNSLEQKLTTSFGVQHATIQLEDVCCVPKHGHEEETTKDSH